MSTYVMKDAFSPNHGYPKLWRNFRDYSMEKHNVYHPYRSESWTWEVFNKSISEFNGRRVPGTSADIEFDSKEDALAFILRFG